MDMLEGAYLHTLKLKKDKAGNYANDAVNSILRGISVSDSLPIPDPAMILCGKIDAYPNGETLKLNLCRECVRPGTVIHFKLTLDQSVLQGKISSETICHSISFFDAYYRKTYLSKFDLPQDSIAFPYHNSLILGGGSGFFAKTLAYPYLGEAFGLHYVQRKCKNCFRCSINGITDTTRTKTVF